MIKLIAFVLAMAACGPCPPDEPAPDLGPVADMSCCPLSMCRVQPDGGIECECKILPPCAE